MRRATHHVVVLCLLATSLAAGPAVAQKSTPEAAMEEKILRIYDFEFPESLDPNVDYSAMDIAALNYEGLTRTDEAFAVVPGAAESWEFSDDELTLTFHLRERLRYSDGSPLTAERFAYAIERTCDPRNEAWPASFLFAIEGCEAWATSLEEAAGTPLATPAGGDDALHEAARAALGVNVPDDRTLVLELREPAPYLPTVASTWVFHPVPREAIESDPDGWWRDPANLSGNGSFQISEIDGEAPGQHIRLVANERYWGGRPKLDGIDNVYFDNPQLALDAYMRGELDIGWTPYPFGNQPEIANDPALREEILEIPISLTIHFGLDLAQEPFQDKKVREAFAYGLDRQGFCDEVWSGACMPAYSWIPPGTPGHIDTEAYAYDVEAARKALAASSYGGAEGLPEIPFYYFVGENDEQSRAEAEWFLKNYRTSLGIELKLIPTTGDEFDTLYAAESAEPLLWWSWIQDYPDPQNWMRAYWTCGAAFYAEKAGYCNPGFDALVAKADRELDPEKRIALYEEAGQMLVDDVATICFIYDTNPRLVEPYVTGYSIRPGDPWPGWSTPLTVDLLDRPAERAAAMAVGTAVS
jgi:oligopeptide transport system substrate-binding protein